MRPVKLAALIVLSGLVLLTPAPRGAAQERTGPTVPSRSGEPRSPQQPARLESPAAESQTKAVATPASNPVYKPVPRGAPTGRVAGGTRGIRQPDLPVLSALVPEHPGLTVREQPTLYWFISGATPLPLEVTLVDPRAPWPVLEVRVAPPLQPGIYGIRLADHGVSLSPGVQYRWFVALIPDADRRSRDILAGGIIERVAPPLDLRPRLAQAASAELPAVYAEAGLWYDALATISELIDATPNDPVLRRHRGVLMSQVGLPAIPE
jgi:hypothetical protein